MFDSSYNCKNLDDLEPLVAEGKTVLAGNLPLYRVANASKPKSIIRHIAKEVLSFASTKIYAPFIKVTNIKHINKTNIKCNVRSTQKRKTKSKYTALDMNNFTNPVANTYNSYILYVKMEQEKDLEVKYNHRKNNVIYAQNFIIANFFYATLTYCVALKLLYWAVFYLSCVLAMFSSRFIFKKKAVRNIEFIFYTIISCSLSFFLVLFIVNMHSILATSIISFTMLFIPTGIFILVFSIYEIILHYAKFHDYFSFRSVSSYSDDVCLILSLKYAVLCIAIYFIQVSTVYLSIIYSILYLIIFLNTLYLITKLIKCANYTKEYIETAIFATISIITVIFSAVVSYNHRNGILMLSELK